MKKYFLLSAIIFSFPIAHAQIITTIAGNGSNVYSGDGMLATTAGVVPTCVAIDSFGDIYISDGNYCIRKVNTSGIISTFAGTGTIGYSGDGGPATAALIGAPWGILLDDSSNLYIAQWQSSVVRKVNAADTIITFAGNDTMGYSGDGGPATAAKLSAPVAIAIDGSGNVYIADYDENRIRKVDRAGIITNFAGTGMGGYSGDGGAATDAELDVPKDVAVDGAGNVYIADQFNQRIRKINTAGIITTIAGNGAGAPAYLGTYSGDGGLATNAGLSAPQGLAVDAIGNVYISDYGNNRVRKVNTAGIISTIVGTGIGAATASIYYSGDGGPATAAEITRPAQIRLDCGGNLYIPDLGNDRVRMVTYNHAPFFAKGATQNLTVCDTAATTLNALLAAYDIDTLQTAAWSVVLPPAHGTAIAAYTATTTGDTLTPTGLSYKPAKGYIGADTLKIAITDCGHLSDTTTIYVTVKGCTAGIEPLTSKSELTVYPNPVTDELHIDGLQNAASYKLLNMVGAVMGAGMLQAGSNNIAVMRLPQGVYILEVNGMEGGREISRIIKE